MNFYHDGFTNKKVTFEKDLINTLFFTFSFSAVHFINSASLNGVLIDYNNMSINSGTSRNMHKQI